MLKANNANFSVLDLTQPGVRTTDLPHSERSSTHKDTEEANYYYTSASLNGSW